MFSTFTDRRLFRTAARGGVSEFVKDTFSGGVAFLENHVGEVGATWVAHPVLNVGQALIDANGTLHGNSASPNPWAIYTASGLPPGADYRVKATLRWVSYLGKFGGPVHAGLYIRQSPTLDVGYHVRTIDVPFSGWMLVRSGGTVLVQVAHGFPLATDLQLELIAEGARIRLIEDGVTLIDVTDGAPVIQTGRVGILFFNTTISDQSNGPHLDNVIGLPL